MWNTGGEQAKTHKNVIENQGYSIKIDFWTLFKLKH